MGKCFFFFFPNYEAFLLISPAWMLDKSYLSPVAINLIVQHIQDILNGEICKWRTSINSHARGFKRAISEQGDLQNGATNPAGKRVLLEPSCRPHWDCVDAWVDRCVQTVNISFTLGLLLLICAGWVSTSDASLPLSVFICVFFKEKYPQSYFTNIQCCNLIIHCNNCCISSMLLDYAFHM